jgi:putative membrane-bound dehydrogenase-like protein
MISARCDGLLVLTKKRMRITALLAAIGCVAAWNSSVAAAGNDLPKCPPGWTVEIVAAAPRVLHPTAVACAPDGRVFVCEDYMDMSGPVDRPVNRILCLHSDGRISVFAENVYVAFRMEYIDGKLYVHHCPKFSVFADGGDASADRTDLIATTNPAPWGSSSRGQNQINDHIPAGFQLAMDGYLYIAVGDKGIHGFVGRDGRRLELPLGGVIRMRPDGTSAEVFATGFRTVLNPAMDAQDNIFLYDNNDHLNIYKTAVGHIVDGGYYGYPWDTRPPRPSYVLPMDVRVYEAGAPTGVLCYEEDALPEAYRGSLFLCDWGRGELISLKLEPRGAGFRAASEEKLLAGHVRPTCIAVAPDGRSFYVGDWQYDGWRSNAKTGRLLKLTYRSNTAAAAKPSWFIPAAMGRTFRASTGELVGGLAHPARAVRTVALRRVGERGQEAVAPLAKLVGDGEAPAHARWHAVWALDRIDGGTAGRRAILEAVTDRAASVRAQAVRQLGTRRAPEGRECVRARLDDADATVRFQAATALGRIGAPEALPALQERLADADPLVRHAAIAAINRIGRADARAWGRIVEGLSSDSPRARESTYLSLRETYDPALVAALAEFAARRRLTGPVRETAYRALFELHRMPAVWDGVWWRLGPLGYLEDSHDARARPPKTREWAGTAAIAAALHLALDDPEPQVRRVAVKNATLALDRETLDHLIRLFDDPKAAADRAAILEALGSADGAATAAPILSVLRRHPAQSELVLPAIAAARKQGGPSAKEALAKLAAADIAPEPLVSALRAIGELDVADAVPIARGRLNHPEVRVRTAAVDVLARIGGDQARDSLILALKDKDVRIRRLAVNALGKLRAKDSVPALLAAHGQPETREDAVLALARVPDARALNIYLEGLAAKNSAVRDGCRKALAEIRIEVRTQVKRRLTSVKLEPLVSGALRAIYANDRELAPLFASDRARLTPADYAAFARTNRGDPRRGRAVFEDDRGVGCIKCHRVNGAGGEGGPDLSRVAANYGQAELIESVLSPSKKVADGFSTTTVALQDGQVISGLLTAEGAERLVVVDGHGMKHEVRKSDVAARTQSDISPMPEGLEAALTLQEFADLIAYLQTLSLATP